MLASRRLATLDVAAGSGLVRVGPRWYVIADDELALRVYDGAPDAARPLAPVRLFPGELPAEHAARKRAKPDLEALANIPGLGLIALGSGSTAARSRGALMADSGDRAVQAIDLAPLHAALRARFPALNLEGATVTGDALVLLQRGNGGAGENARIDLDLARVRAALAAAAAWDAELVRAIVPVELGDLDGVPLGFTDASGLAAGRLAFAAAAEDTTDTYNDGLCTGSVVGLLAADGRVLCREPLDIRCKVEGLHAEPAGDGLDLYLVCDADDPAVPSPLLFTHLPL